MARQAGRTQETRRRIAIEAARLISEGGLRDYHQAKLKAAARLGILDELSLPANSDIEEALREHQRLFQGDRHTDLLRRLREVALEAMRFFKRFDPRLVGAVLEGTADEHSAVCLHLYSDHLDEVTGYLRENGIPWEQQSRKLRLDRNNVRDFPALLFRAGDEAIDLTVLPYDLLRQAPLGRVDDKPMQRATMGALERLLGDDDPRSAPPRSGR